MDERVKEEEEERDAWMADPFPDEKLRYSNVHPSMDVVDVEEDEEEMFTTDTLTLRVFDVLEVMVRD